MVLVHTLCTHRYWNQHLQQYRRHTDTVYWYWNTSIKKSCVHYFVTVIAVFALDDCFNYPRLLLDCCGVQVWQKAPLVYLQQSLTKPKKTKVHFDELIKQYTSPSPTAPTGPLCDDSSQTWSERQKRKRSHCNISHTAYCSEHCPWISSLLSFILTFNHQERSCRMSPLGNLYI